MNKVGLGIGIAAALGGAVLVNKSMSNIRTFNQTQATIAEIRKTSTLTANEVDQFVSRYSTTHEQALDSAKKALAKIKK